MYHWWDMSKCIEILHFRLTTAMSQPVHRSWCWNHSLISVCGSMAPGNSLAQVVRDLGSRPKITSYWLAST
jgi:hypothetical protein